MFDPQGKIVNKSRRSIDMRTEPLSIGAAPTQDLYEGGAVAEGGGMGYPKNQTFWISVIEDPIATLDPKDQKPPRFALSPKAYLAPSVEVAFLMAAKDILPDADLQRCRVRVGEG